MKTKLMSIGCMALAVRFNCTTMPKWTVFVALLCALVYWIYDDNEPDAEPNYEL